MLRDMNVYEIDMGDNERQIVDRDLWRSWTGIRLLNMKEFHDDVFIMDSENVYDGPRVCPCEKCQSTVLPEFRFN